MNKRSVKKFFALAAVLAVLSIALISVKMAGGSMKSDHGMLPDCPYSTGQNSMCPMDLVDHMTVFKQTFTLAAVGAWGLVLIMLFTPFVLADLLRLDILNFSLIEKLRRFEDENFSLQLFDWLKLVLARGLMQPKLYPLPLV